MTKGRVLLVIALYVLLYLSTTMVIQTYFLGNHSFHGIGSLTRYIERDPASSPV